MTRSWRLRLDDVLKVPPQMRHGNFNVYSKQHRYVENKTKGVLNQICLNGDYKKCLFKYRSFSKQVIFINSVTFILEIRLKLTKGRMSHLAVLHLHMTQIFFIVSKGGLTLGAGPLCMTSGLNTTPHRG